MGRELREENHIDLSIKSFYQILTALQHMVVCILLQAGGAISEINYSLGETPAFQNQVQNFFFAS